MQIGTSDEYGDQEAPQNEKMSARPISSYSLGKAAATELLQTLFRTESFPCTVLRLFLVYGPGQDNKRFLSQIINGCLSNDTFPVSKGEQLRDFCYIDDIVDGILMSLDNDRVNGEIINIASGKPISIRDLVEYINEVIGQGEPEFDKIPYRKGENMKLYADIRKAREILDWSPKTSLKKGIELTLDHYRKRFD